MKIQSFTQTSIPRTLPNPSTRVVEAEPREPQESYQGTALALSAGAAVGGGLGVAAGFLSGIPGGALGTVVGASGGAALGMALAFVASQQDSDPSAGGAYQAMGALGGLGAGALIGGTVGALCSGSAPAAALGLVGAAGGALYAYINQG